MLYGPMIIQPAIRKPKYRTAAHDINRKIFGSDFFIVKISI